MSLRDGRLSTDESIYNDRQTVIFNRMMADFIDHWAPKHSRERAAFAADITSLMRQCTLHQAEIYDRIIRSALGPMMPLSHSFPLTGGQVLKTDKEPTDAVAKQSGDEAGAGQQPSAPGKARPDVLGRKEVPE